MVKSAAPQSISDVFLRTATSYPHNTFFQIRDPQTNTYQKITYEQAHEQTTNLSAFLSTKIKPKDHVAILSDNRPEWCIAYLAIIRAGATAVHLDPNLPVKDIQNLLKHSEAKALFTSNRFEQNMHKIKPQLKKLKTIISFDQPTNQKTAHLTQLINKSKKKNQPKITHQNDVASLIYTSGTSGTPKGVMLTHANFLYQLRAGSKALRIFNKDNYIVLLPLHHAFAFTSIFLFGMKSGATLTFIHSLKKEEIFQTIKDTRITILCAVPKIFEAINTAITTKIEQLPKTKKNVAKALTSLNALATDTLDINLGKKLFKQIHQTIGPSLRLMISGGAAIPVQTLTSLKSFGILITEGYGLTETSPVITFNDPKTGKLGSVGKPLQGTQIKIIRKNKHGIGEVIVKGPGVMKGYYKEKTKTNQTIKDDWLHTKDSGYIDKHGFLFLKGRKDDTIVLPNGKNVFPDDVESHYKKSSFIEEICVLGIKPQSSNHEHVHACIVPTQNLSQKPYNEQYDKIKQELDILSRSTAPHKRIFSFDIVTSDDLPKTSTLKYKRFQIKKALLSKRTNTQHKAQSQKVHDPPSTQKHQDLTQTILHLLQKHSGKKDVTPQSHLSLDLFLDSLAIADITSELEQHLNISIPTDANPNISTASDLIQHISSFIQQTPTNIHPKPISQSLHQYVSIPNRSDHSSQGQKIRAAFVTEKTSTSLPHLLGEHQENSTLQGNIEHFIGMTQIPTGIAGPIHIEGTHTKGTFLVPLATTEGALVASVHRGMNVLTRSGAVRTTVLRGHLTKAPMFIFSNLHESLSFKAWFQKRFKKIQRVANSTTKHGKLVDYHITILGKRVLVMFTYHTGDALGANMITMATDQVCKYIAKTYGIEEYHLQSNLEGEKKVTSLNFHTSRGKNVVADATISKKIVETYLHTTVQDIVRIYQNSTYGSLAAGMQGANAHAANIITALFIATGQDVAHVHDGSVCLTTMEKTQEGDLYISVNLPSLPIGTVGGGTGLATQRECLEIMGCYGSGKVNKLAEIIAASVLAGDLSLAASQAAGDFAQAHNTLGRNRPDKN